MKENLFVKLSDICLALFYWPAVALITLFCNILGGALATIPTVLTQRKDGYYFHRVAVLWGHLIGLIIPFWRFEIEGQENVQQGKAYVVVANHQSMIDILAMLYALPMPFKFLAKKELFSVPFLGWHMRLAGYIPLQRSSKESGKKAIFAVARCLRQGVSVVLFPEGTRSPDGNIKSFKIGAFKIAAEEGLDVLPIVIEGTGNALPKNSWFIEQKTVFKVSIGKPVPISKSESTEDAKEMIRQKMIERLKALRKFRS